MVPLLFEEGFFFVNEGVVLCLPSLEQVRVNFEDKGRFEDAL
jgi:hypothetical protein